MNRATVFKIRKLHGLDPDAWTFKVVYGTVAADDKEIVIHRYP
jgi:hypothetical protein